MNDKILSVSRRCCWEYVFSINIYVSRKKKKRVKNENCGVASFHTNATPFPSLKDKCVCMYIPHPYEHMYNHTARDVRARARAVEIQAGKAEVGSPLAGSQVRARRYTRTRLASTGVPGGARRQPRTDVDTKPRPELLRTTVQRACVPRPDHGGAIRAGRSRENRFRWSILGHVCRVTSFRERETTDINHGGKDRDRQIYSWIFALDRRSRLILGFMPTDSRSVIVIVIVTPRSGELVTWLSRRAINLGRRARSFRQF